MDVVMKSKNRAIVESSDRKWLHCLAFLTDHLCCLNVKIQGKNKLITKMYCNNRALLI